MLCQANLVRLCKPWKDLGRLFILTSLCINVNPISELGLLREGSASGRENILIRVRWPGSPPGGGSHYRKGGK